MRRHSRSPALYMPCSDRHPLPATQALNGGRRSQQRAFENLPKNEASRPRRGHLETLSINIERSLDGCAPLSRPSFPGRVLSRRTLRLLTLPSIPLANLRLWSTAMSWRRPPPQRGHGAQRPASARGRRCMRPPSAGGRALWLGLGCAGSVVTAGQLSEIWRTGGSSASRQASSTLGWFQAARDEHLQRAGTC